MNKAAYFYKLSILLSFNRLNFIQCVDSLQNLWTSVKFVSKNIT